VRSCRMTPSMLESCAKPKAATIGRRPYPTKASHLSDIVLKAVPAWSRDVSRVCSSGQKRD
jgi:hypothetical protein